VNNTQKPVAIVTGVSSGIGLGLTLARIKQGHDVVGTSRSTSKSKELKASSEASAQQLQWLDRIFVVHALKVGLAGVLSLFVAQALRLQYPEWAPFTVILAASFQRLDDEINQWLRAGELQELPTDQLAAYLRCQSYHRLGSTPTEVPRTHSGLQFGAKRAANGSDRLGDNFARRTDRKCKHYFQLNVYL
jgi:NAD(P)-dependent dehydrogenase (short-subunit alcohol dehydrogenase family)